MQNCRSSPDSLRIPKYCLKVSPLAATLLGGPSIFGLALRVKLALGSNSTWQAR